MYPIGKKRKGLRGSRKARNGVTTTGVFRRVGKVRYQTRTSRVNGRLVVVHFVEEGPAGGDAVGSVGYVLAHVRNCGHLSRKRETGGEG